nr:F-box/WD repeat-containing protein 5 isoform X2 [Nomia melanderi]
MSTVENEAENHRNGEEEIVASDNESDCLLEILEDEKWCYMPDSILLNIFQFLTPRELITAGEVCKSWHRVSYDEFLWKNLFYQKYEIDSNVGMMPGKTSWLQEFKRLTYHIPLIKTDELTQHSNEVLHVWESQYPVTIKYFYDMKTFRWQYTQFSQFNSSDTLLLVSGAYFGTPYATSGEIAIFSLTPDFDLQCRVANNPHDMFGTWYSEHYLLSGSLHWLTHTVSASVIWLNKANQESSSEDIPIITQLFRFCNGNGSSVRAIILADCLTSEQDESEIQKVQSSSSNVEEIEETLPNQIVPLDVSFKSGSWNLKATSEEHIFKKWEKFNDCFKYISPLQYNPKYSYQNRLSFRTENSRQANEQSINTEDANVDEIANNCEKYLIFTTGTETFIPHQVAFKRVKNVKFPTSIYPGRLYTLKERKRDRKLERERERERQRQNPNDNVLDIEAIADKFDNVDHVIDFNGHIVGMGLSPDHRYLYVNVRPWPQDYVITNLYQYPPAAKEVDIHVIDLITLKQVGCMSRAYKKYDLYNKCLLIFLDVCNEYVASGAEEKYGYLWDRYYGVCLAKYPHSDVVNSVAFNPRDPEMLITTSDDCTIKVWRSRAKVHALGLNKNSFPRGKEIRNRYEYSEFWNSK